ncbi:hypothetical protein PsYK624_057760 [Phanerochaete sordida]|uniref:Uncharacterized protein n=1 Tax=Phanerochaete sordida TaxID=48140 RepID=A0A9P3G915_9APHY|nr:hypothetical protein PsYK624_057760 [Phanerochaete sordida]
MAKTPLLPAVAVHSAEEDMVATRMWHMEAEARRQAKRVLWCGPNSPAAQLAAARESHGAAA